MAKATVKLLTTLGAKLVRHDGEFEARNVAQVLDRLAGKYGSEFREEIYDGGEIKNFYIVLHNGEVIDREHPEAVPLSDGDTIHVFPPVSGG